VKLGSDGCLLPDGSPCPVPQALDPIDTSGAGDAFNGAYLAARTGCAKSDVAALVGNALAGWNVKRHGVIPGRDEAAPTPDNIFA